MKKKKNIKQRTQWCEKCNANTDHYMQMSDCGEFEIGYACQECAAANILDILSKFATK